ncbi:DUF1330 domain-containing protein [Reinekea sp.]|jgi:uncharacterized protein (DUF1330 family)|uniref:DUF1330 domain-containing protein n=1 Tax=Reinekea sp. TaxID=1970455 RepID=UPI003989A32B
MAVERIMGLFVTDDEEYQRYREGMVPILHTYGGSFGYDFKVSEVLISKTEGDINRVFTIDFPSIDIMESFFSDPEYQTIQKTHFAKSVSSKTIISIHEKALNE